MSAKSVVCSLLLLTVLGSGAAHGQTPYPGPISSSGSQTPYTPNNPLDEPTALPGGGDDPALQKPTIEPPGSISRWILGHSVCQGPLDGNGPISEEVFSRFGASVPFGGGTFGSVLQTGFAAEAGARTLFFEKDRTAAWTVELSVLSIWNHASGQDHPVSLNVLVPPSAAGATFGVPIVYGQNGVPGVTVKSLNRTFANLGFGRECYLWGSAGCGSATWRVGFDVGGRYGDETVTFSEIRHRDDTVEGAYVSLHTDYEIPCGILTYVAGFRAEMDYTFSDILQAQNNAANWGLNCLFNLGVRF